MADQRSMNRLARTSRRPAIISGMAKTAVTLRLKARILNSRVAEKSLPD
jgi:hypothetical protein